ncbi:hypothetical protein [Rhizobium terrae]|uniref:hypothetical protein n=1 Tax=Rhizobium terrae TaxID=2171756 RepID=UPI000E3C7981|nr:hypothetical protein [Rhizobium terrae]
MPAERRACIPLRRSAGHLMVRIVGNLTISVDQKDLIGVGEWKIRPPFSVHVWTVATDPINSDE